MIDFIHSIIDYAVTIIGFVIVWIFRDLQAKANRSEVSELKTEVKELRRKVFDSLEKLATKDDFSKLELKIDKLFEREMDKGRKK